MGVAWFVGLSVTTVGRAKLAEPIEMLLGTWTWVGPRTMYLMGVQIPTREGAILRVKRGWPATCSFGGQYIRSNSAGGGTGMVCMPVGVH